MAPRTTPPPPVTVQQAADAIRVWLVQTGRYTGSTLELQEALVQEISRVVVDPDVSLRSAVERIWVTHCLFKKNGFPSLGQFGVKEAPVVILPLETWTRLCKEIPELGARQFQVGTQE